MLLAETIRRDGHLTRGAEKLSVVQIVAMDVQRLEQALRRDHDRADVASIVLLAPGADLGSRLAGALHGSRGRNGRQQQQYVDDE